MGEKRLAPALLHILQHSLGVDQFGQGDHYRNRFVTGEGSDDHPLCEALCAMGLMKVSEPRPSVFSGMDLFFVTEAGKRAMAENSPAPPKMTRAQKRYRAWLDGPADWMTFGDYLRSECA